jgi:hypothetical protein
MTKQLAPAPLVNWSRILDEVRGAGYTIREIAQYTQIPRTTLLGYQNLCAEPRHSSGDRLLRFWAQVTGKDASAAPMFTPPPSAAEYRRM